MFNNLIQSFRCRHTLATAPTRLQSDAVRPRRTDARTHLNKDTSGSTADPVVIITSIWRPPGCSHVNYTASQPGRAAVALDERTASRTLRALVYKLGML